MDFGGLYSYTHDRAARGLIDPLAYLETTPLYLYSGMSDSIVHQAEMIAAAEAQKAAQEAKRRRAALAEAERREKRAEEAAEARARMSAAEYERTILDLRQKLQVSFALLPAALRKSR